MTDVDGGRTAELLSALIRNACVNDGTPDSGEERRNADLLQTYLEGAGLDVERFTARSDRTSIVAVHDWPAGSRSGKDKAAWDRRAPGASMWVSRRKSLRR